MLQMGESFDDRCTVQVFEETDDDEEESNEMTSR